MNFNLMLLHFPSFSLYTQKDSALSLVCILLMHFFGSFCAATNETDRLALLAIKSKILQDPQGVLNSWNNSLHFCEWEGITCGRRHQRVITLDFPSKGLVGTLSPYVGNLTFLWRINLLENSLQGSIPPEVGRLFRLQQLVLYNNSLEGDVPSNISQCSNLRHLGLGYNKLVGKIPNELSSFLKLKILALDDNNLVGGIPPSFGNLTSLKSLAIGYNSLEGSIPDEIGLLKDIQQVGFGANKLSGTIPLSIYNLSSLTILSLAQNQLHGSLPSNIGVMLPRLQMLELGSNQFSGPLPLSLSNCSELEFIYMEKNNFTGKIAINFGHLRNLRRVILHSNSFGTGEHDEMDFISSMANQSTVEVLDLSNNKLRGMIPDSVGNLSTKILYLSTSNNYLYGRLPMSMTSLVSLTAIFLSNNRFTGTLPFNIGNLQNLHVLDLTDNEFSGKIPHSIGNLTVINNLYLSANNLEGTIPSSLGKCKTLISLLLDQNNLIGSIPKQLFDLSTLSIVLNLSQNQLSGKIPPEIGNLKNLVSLSVSQNDLSGEIPTSIGRCTSLQFLYLDNNSFQGSIPTSLSSLRAMEELHLSRNNFSGQIPRFLETFPLSKLNLSFNDLEGEVPTKGVFMNVSAISVVGNTRLCGGVLELHLPKCPSKNSKKRKNGSHALMLVISITCPLLGIGVVSSFLFWWLTKKRRMQPSKSKVKESFLKVSYERILKATNGFSLENLIGVGGFGSVYKGFLEDGMVVAVKVLKLQLRGASKSFMAECEALRNIRHRNIVKIITSCSSIDFQGNDFKALVYEFMPNGSLDKWLHSSPRTIDGQEELYRLGLLQRIDIAIDVANALDYLHHQSGEPIIHCDIKPSNILLDKDMVAHVGDFGLARSLLSELPSANQSSSIGIRGTIGYVAPEYGLGSEISANGDVYSFGILLLEMITGKRPNDPMFEEGFNLHNYARMALPDRVTEIVEPILLSSHEEGMATTAIIGSDNAERANNRKRNEDYLISIVKIGVACSMESPKDRMDISNIIHELHLIRGIL